jgi:hypothetical protein
MCLEFTCLSWGPGVHLQRLFAADPSLGIEILSFGNKHLASIGSIYICSLQLHFGKNSRTSSN